MGETNLDQFKDTIVNINGEIYSHRDAQISVFDRGFLYGDSIYEVTYSDDRTLMFLDEHMSRLENSAHLIGLNLSYDREFFTQEILKTLKQSNLSRAYIRLVVTRGISAMTLDPNVSLNNNFVIIVRPLMYYPEELYLNGQHLMIASILRNDRKSTNPNAKSGNYLNNVLAMSEAKKSGAQDAIMVNAEGHVTEGTTFNIWMVKNGKVLTPSHDSGLLKGITRAKLLNLCEKHHINYAETKLTAEDFLKADEVFTTSSTKGVMPVRRLNDTIYGEAITDWPITAKLAKLYNELVKSHKNMSQYSY